MSISTTNCTASTTATFYYTDIGLAKERGRVDTKIITMLCLGPSEYCVRTVLFVKMGGTGSGDSTDRFQTRYI